MLCLMEGKEIVQEAGTQSRREEGKKSREGEDCKGAGRRLCAVTPLPDTLPPKSVKCIQIWSILEMYRFLLEIEERSEVVPRVPRETKTAYADAETRSRVGSRGKEALQNG